MVELDTAGSRRRIVGATAGVLCVVAATAVLLPFRDDVTSATPGLILVLPCVVAALMGGRTAGLVVAVVAAGAFNLVFLEPYGTFKVASIDDVVAFVVLALVAFIVATLVAREGERRRAAVQRTAEVEALWRANAQMQAEQARLAAEMQALEAVDVQRCGIAAIGVARPAHATWRRSGRSCRISASASPTTKRRVDDLLELVADEAERLDRLVQNLLSMSRHRGGVAATCGPGRADRRAARRPGASPRPAVARHDGDRRCPVRSAAGQRRLHDGRAGGHQPAGERQPPLATARRDRGECQAPRGFRRCLRARIKGPGSTPATSSGCSGPSSAEPRADRSGSAWRSAGRSSRPTAARSPSGRRTANGTRSGGARLHLHPSGAPWLTRASCSSSTTNRRSPAALAAALGARGYRVAVGGERRGGDRRRSEGEPGGGDPRPRSPRRRRSRSVPADPHVVGRPDHRPDRRRHRTSQGGSARRRRRRLRHQAVLDARAAGATACGDAPSPGRRGWTRCRDRGR